MHLTAILFLTLSTLFILPSTASLQDRRNVEFTAGPPLTQVITPTPVSVQLSTYQLSTARPVHVVASNKAFFISAGATSVDVYDADTNTWSVSASGIDTLGDLLATADDYLVFTDSTTDSLLHILNAETLSWTTIELPEGLARFYVAAGNYLFYSGSFAYTLIVYDIADDSWTTFEEQYEMADSNLRAFKYQTYAMFVRGATRSGYITAWNTVGDVTRGTFSYGGDYRLFPTIAVAGDYLVIAGGVFETSYSSDFSIYNPQRGETFTGNMPTARYAMTIIYVEPLMMFIKDTLIETFNLDTQQWQSSVLDVSISDIRVSTNNKLFMVYGDQDYVIEFDSLSQTWSNLTFADSSVGNLVKLGDLAAFVDVDNIVSFSPTTQQWTRAQFTSGNQFFAAFTVSGKALVVSSDQQTVGVTDLSLLAPVTVTPQASPATPQSSPQGTPTSAPVSSVPWSPWTPPVPSPSAPTALPTPTSDTVPSVVSTPTSSPVTSSPVTQTEPTAPSVVSAPVTGTVPTSNNNQTSASFSKAASLFALIGSAILIL